MTPGDRDPSPEQPSITEWNGSKITIHNMDDILRDASQNITSIYDRSDFPFPIERMSVMVRVAQHGGEETLLLGSAIHLDSTHQWRSDLNLRFRNYLLPQYFQSTRNQKHPPFHIRDIGSGNVFQITDDETGGRFVLLVDDENGSIQLINDGMFIGAGDDMQLSVHPPALHTVMPENQLKSLMKATALAADFVNGIPGTSAYSNLQQGDLPLKREYIIGQERRKVTGNVPTNNLGKAALVHIPKPNITPDSNINHNPEITPGPNNITGDDIPDIEKLSSEESISLARIGGLERVKKTLQDIAISFKHPEIMEKWGAKRPQGVLLYGEPGTGKTMLAQALAHEIGAELWLLQSTDIYEKWLGNSEQHIKHIFSKARQKNKPTVLFFDEFDSIVGISDKPRTSGADSARNAVAGIFKQEMNTLSKENSNILVVAATNHLDKIDPSLIRSGRFDYKLYIPMPDQDARQQILANIISNAVQNESDDTERLLLSEDQEETNTFHIFSDQIQVVELAASMEGMSGADIAEILRRLSLAKAMDEARTGVEQPPINNADIQRAIKDFNAEG